MEQQYEVSVICITYNQEKYIEKALDSILAQDIPFPYEVIVHDDVSTDRTQEILMRYEAEYPNVIRLLLEDENQGSKGIDFFSPIVRDVARGKYVAVCEGDDFWTNKDKLRIQWDALEEHPECDMCACWGCTTTEDGMQEVSQIRPLIGDGILSPEQVILGGGQYLVTAGLFFRRSMYERMMPFEKVIALDYAWQIKGALRGGIYYVDKKLAVYRRYAVGSWTNRILKNKDKLRLQWEKERALLETLDQDTAGKYHEAICQRMKVYVSFISQLEDRKDDVLKLMRTCSYPCYIWGMGRRGESLEEFLKKENIKIDGVCDIVNTNIGERTAYGNIIVSTSDVLRQGKVILASSRFAYEDLKNMNFSGRIVDFQQYMPLG